jgi:hypothetical protein
MPSMSAKPRTAKAADESVETIIQVGEYSSMSSTGHDDPSTSIEKFAECALAAIRAISSIVCWSSSPDLP